MNEQTDLMTQEEISLDRYLVAVWRAKWIIILGTVAAAAIAAFLAYRQPVQYRASADLKVGRVWEKPLEDTYITERIINSSTFLEEVARRHQIKPNQLKRSIQARTVTAGPRRSRYPLLVGIEATADNPETAAGFVKIVADEMIARHEAMFNDAMKPHIEEQQRLEAYRNELAAQGAASRELLLKVETELGQLKASNSSASATEKSALIADVSSSGTIRPGIWRSTATAGLIAALALIVAAALTVHVKPALKRAAAGNKS